LDAEWSQMCIGVSQTLRAGLPLIVTMPHRFAVGAMDKYRVKAEVALAALVTSKGNAI